MAVIKNESLWLMDWIIKSANLLVQFSITFLSLSLSLSKQMIDSDNLKKKGTCEFLYSIFDFNVYCIFVCFFS